MFWHFLRILWALPCYAALVIYGHAAVADQLEFLPLGNRSEGRVPDKFSTSQVQLVNFLYGMEQFDPQSDEALYVSFYRPDAHPVVVRGYEVSLSKRYLMVSDPLEWPIGEVSTFGPWPTKDRLAPLGISAAQLGVVVYVNEDPEDDLPLRLVPASVSLGSTAPAATELIVTWHPLVPLNRYFFSVIDQSSGRSLFEKPVFEKEDADTHFDLRLPIDGWTNGWKTFRFFAQPEGGPTVNIEFEFYHGALK